MVVLGQALRSVAMIHASTNFSHSVAFRKLQGHRLVTDGIYAYVVPVCTSVRYLTAFRTADGFAILRTQGSFTGHSEHS